MLYMACWIGIDTVLGHWSRNDLVRLKNEKNEDLRDGFEICHVLGPSEVSNIFDMLNMMCMAQVWGIFMTGPGFGHLRPKM